MHDGHSWASIFRTRSAWDLDRDSIRHWVDNNEAFFRLVTKYVTPGADILELGCGPGRHALGLAALGYAVTGVDHNDDMVAQARRNASRIGLAEASFFTRDMNDLESIPGSGRFAAITHGGVLEHCASASAILHTLDTQFRAAPVVIFDVPVATDRNARLFAQDEMFRQEWTSLEWLALLGAYDVLEWAEERRSSPSMTDDFVAAIRAVQPR